jgi:hypothetical protein
MFVSLEDCDWMIFPMIAESGCSSCVCPDALVLILARPCTSLLSTASYLRACTLDSFIANFRILQFLIGELRTVPSPQTLRDWFMIFNSIYVDESLAQGGASVHFVVCQLIKIPEDVEELHLFEIFHLD